MTHRNLAKRALAARKYSFSPFSKFRVGAALLTRQGEVYTGCNIESSSYGLTMCAERTALFKAISEGKRRFLAMAIATDERGFTPPCGACRQVMYDLAGNIDVILAREGGKMQVMKLLELFPHPFDAENLKRA